MSDSSVTEAEKTWQTQDKQTSPQINRPSAFRNPDLLALPPASPLSSAGAKTVRFSEDRLGELEALYRFFAHDPKALKYRVRAEASTPAAQGNVSTKYGLMVFRA